MVCGIFEDIQFKNVNKTIGKWSGHLSNIKGFFIYVKCFYKCTNVMVMYNFHIFVKMTKYMIHTFVVLLTLRCIACHLSVYEMLLNEILVLCKCFQMFSMNTTSTLYCSGQYFLYTGINYCKRFKNN